ncbi:MAG: Asp23/Gls24 family envelope stress response protein [Halanaerobiaceae bacterium]
MAEGSEVGTIKIANEVIEIIAKLAASEVDGVAGMSGSVVGGIAEMLKGKTKNLSKGVEVDAGEEKASVNLSVIVEYGTSIPDIAWQIQKKVKQAIENMTGLEVEEINVKVQGVQFKDEIIEEEEEEGEEE